MYRENEVLSEAVDHLVKNGHTEAEANKVVSDILAEVSLKDPSSYSEEEKGLLEVYEVLYSDARPADLIALGKVYEVKKVMETARTVSPDATINDLTGERTISVQPTNAPAAATTRTRTEFVRPTLDSGEAAILTSLVENNRTAMLATTRQTSIQTLLTQKPDPSTYLLDGNGNPLTVIPEVAPEKLQMYRERLVGDEENIEAFNAIERAVNNKVALPVYIKDSANNRVIGIVVSTGEAGKDSIILTIPALQGFLISEVIGLIPGTPGVTISKWSQKTPSVGAGQGQITNTVAYPTLRWEGRKEAFENGMSDSVCEPMDAAGAVAYGIESHTRSGRVRIEDSFRISTVTRAGKASSRVIRLTGVLETQPRWVVKAEYADHFASPERKRVISIPTNDRELAAALEHVETGIAAIMSQSYSPGRDTLSNNPVLAEMVRALRTASAEGMDVDTAM